MRTVKFLLLPIFLLGSQVSFAQDRQIETQITTHENINTNEALFNRIESYIFLEPVFNAVFEPVKFHSYSLMLSLQDDPFSIFKDSKELTLESIRTGGFELYDEQNNLITVSHDIHGNYSLESSAKSWVRPASPSWRNKKYKTNTGMEYEVDWGLSLHGRFRIKRNDGYQITVNLTNFSGRTKISDNEGREVFIKQDRYGQRQLIQADKVIKTLRAQTVENYIIEYADGRTGNIRFRGRWGDLMVNGVDGEQWMIKNRYIKQKPPVVESSNEKEKENEKEKQD